ncbi:mRNA cap guanine-N7 methyltransferase-like isoform X1 [Panicum hallii]|uniref:mRNA cap guanine-N7 methyltransferase-like isoform X1 n=1 Tax=Panicum hallii TaxID=206008 RepID=UPI000DF4F0FF|nr:mRNA cap guanine-N7 methyltransferase-like isoform X1 [Panicum hallii]
MASGRQATKPQQHEAEQDFDPKYEWQENAASFVLRLHLSEGFRKEDFRVQVDSTGRLTVRGQRADGGKHSRFSKTFQLPAASNLDTIAGRFDAGVLTLTVPKKVVDDAKPKEDVNKAPPSPPQGQGKPKEDEAKKPQASHKEAAEMTTAKKPKDDTKPKEDATNKKKPPAPAAEQQVDAKRGKPEQEQPKAAAPPATVRKEEAKPEAEAAAPPPADKKQAAPRPPQADAERKAVDPESLAAVTAKRRAEEERAKAAAEEAERQRTRRGLRERVQEELEGLAGSEWAEGLVETVKKNKEVIATAVAAFSLGLVASRLFCRN